MLAVATYLKGHAKVSWVKYAGLLRLFDDIKADLEQALAAA